MWLSLIPTACALAEMTGLALGNTGGTSLSWMREPVVSLNPGQYRWWLDVETITSWESSTRNNRADLEGMAAYFHHIGGTVGICNQ